MRGVVYVAALAALLFAACGDDDGGATPVSGIEGRVLYAPSCGVEGTSCPASGISSLLITRLGDDAVIPARTDSSGGFQVPLAPGDYNLSVQPETGTDQPTTVPTSPLLVTVNAGELTRVEITYTK